MNIYKRKDGRFEGREYVKNEETGKRSYRSFYGRSLEELINKYERSWKYRHAEKHKKRNTSAERKRNCYFAETYIFRSKYIFINHAKKRRTSCIKVQRFLHLIFCCSNCTRLDYCFDCTASTCRINCMSYMTCHIPRKNLSSLSCFENW